MDIINDNVEHPQKVEVIKPLDVHIESSDLNPVKVVFPDAFISNPNRLSVVDLSTHANDAIVKPISPNVNGFISVVHVVNSGVGYVFPINQHIVNVDKDNLKTAIIPSLHSSFVQQFSSATSIVVFYSYQNSSRVYHFEFYNGGE